MTCWICGNCAADRDNNEHSHTKTTNKSVNFFIKLIFWHEHIKWFYGVVVTYGVLIPVPRVRSSVGPFPPFFFFCLKKSYSISLCFFLWTAYFFENSAVADSETTKERIRATGAKTTNKSVNFFIKFIFWHEHIKWFYGVVVTYGVLIPVPRVRSSVGPSLPFFFKKKYSSAIFFVVSLGHLFFGSDFFNFLHL